MNAFVALAKEKGMADLASTVCATGGGAYKFEPDFTMEVNMSLNKFDELDSLICGVEFMVENSNKNHELFYYDDPQVFTLSTINKKRIKIVASQRFIGLYSRFLSKNGQFSPNLNRK